MFTDRDTNGARLDATRVYLDPSRPGNINYRDKNHTGFSPAKVDVDTDRNN